MRNLSLIFGFVAVSMFAIGCEKPTAIDSGADAVHASDDGQVDPHAGHDHAAHDHSPPHGGHLIELGRNHEYHAELVDDHKSESVTIYMMDADMNPLTVNQPSLSLVLTAGDNTQTFELMSSQPDGSAEFKSSDKNLMEMMESEGVKGKLRVTIGEKPFSGSFDHIGHDHD